MRHLHETLRSTHHMKHGGRTQYGLFIKGIGLTLEHSLKFWRDEFTKGLDVDKASWERFMFLFSLSIALTYYLLFAVRKAVCV